MGPLRKGIMMDQEKSGVVACSKSSMPLATTLSISMLALPF